MKTITYSTFLEDPDWTIEQAWADGERVLVTREGGRSFFVSSPDAEDEDATEYLMRQPNNAARLLESIRQLEEGKVVYKTMERLEAMAE